MAKTEVCPRCGASTAATICEYCGSLVGDAPDRTAERDALDELHRLVSSKPPEVRADILAHGFLPHDPEILIEAGLRCVSLLDSAYVGPGAAARLDVVIAKLRIHEPTPAASRAIQTFEEKLEKHRARERRFERAGCLALAIVGLGAVWLFVKLFVWIGIKVWP